MPSPRPVAPAPRGAAALLRRLAGPGALLLLALPVIGTACSKRTTAPDPGGTVSGVALLPGGAPAAGADVYLVLLTTDPAAATLDLVVADSLGRFTFRAVTPGDHLVGARAADTLAVADTVHVPRVAGNAAAETASVALHLARAGVFRGRALLAGASDHRGIVVTAPDVLSLAATDSLGAYALTGIPVGRWGVDAERPPAYLAARTSATLATPGDTVTLPDLVLASPRPRP
ncbi:MAG: carboxypeptidase regulatory-like domain-containing protein [Candidatus Eisenbacteria bacterium]|nr:carboxypeptidase regulatory-like domain-containing protein [Candidatus Eisenbacteria bacterium]